MLPALTLCAVAATSFVVPQARRARERISGVPRACQSQPEEPPFQVGQRVEGLYGASKLGVSFGCRWFSGDVVAERPDGSFDLQYDDGEREEGVLPRYMRLPGAAPAPLSAAGTDEDEPPWIVCRSPNPNPSPSANFSPSPSLNPSPSPSPNSSPGPNPSPTLTLTLTLTLTPTPTPGGVASAGGGLVRTARAHVAPAGCEPPTAGGVSRQPWAGRAPGALGLGLGLGLG